LKMQGCQVEVITFGKSASGKLREETDDFIDLDTDIKKYVMGNHFNNRSNNRSPKKEDTRSKSQSSAPVNKTSGRTTKVIRKMR